ncbi:hypothetical protein L1049_024539 [Liquidambar formosana]|uniref:Peptidase A1 domain-containing protein n=1 Tax=Liquidambar formosana TaxID=63359 RepID=A0AAP0RUP1_LIQFO
MALIRRIIAVQALFFLIHSPVITTSSHSPKEGRSIHIKLFHCDSPPSPFHNLNESPTEKANKSFKRSIPRHAYLSGMEITGNAFQGGIEADNGEYLVKFSIGSPPSQILAIMDTASDLVWTQCLPCDHCHNQLNLIILDPSKSSTCTNLTCNTPSCTLLPNWNCDSSNWCNYIYSYTDFSHSKG